MQKMQIARTAKTGTYDGSGGGGVVRGGGGGGGGGGIKWSRFGCSSPRLMHYFPSFFVSTAAVTIATQPLLLLLPARCQHISFCGTKTDNLFEGDDT